MTKRKVVLQPFQTCDGQTAYKVVETLNTVQPEVNSTLERYEVEKLVQRGFIVEITPERKS